MINFVRNVLWHSTRCYLKVYYRLKVFLVKKVVGREEGLASVLYTSLVPELVLAIGGAKTGTHVRINRHLMVHQSRGSFRDLEIGDDVHIGKGVVIDLTGKVRIGNRVGIGMFAKVLTHQNLGDSVLKERYPAVSGDMEIPDDTFIGAGSMVLYPSVLQPRTLIAAGAVVRGSYEHPCLLVGNPARVMSRIDAPPENPSE